jgi:hypothetical protein
LLSLLLISFFLTGNCQLITGNSKVNAMNRFSSAATDREGLHDWFVILALAVGFFLWGIFIFFAVGVKWPPAWNFGAVVDVPGLSEYSTAGQRSLPTVNSPFLHEQAELTPQHVMGRRQPLNSKVREQKP